MTRLPDLTKQFSSSRSSETDKVEASLEARSRDRRRAVTFEGWTHFLAPPPPPSWPVPDSGTPSLAPAPQQVPVPVVAVGLSYATATRAVWPLAWEVWMFWGGTYYYYGFNPNELALSPFPCFPPPPPFRGAGARGGVPGGGVKAEGLEGVAAKLLETHLGASVLVDNFCCMHRRHQKREKGREERERREERRGKREKRKKRRKKIPVREEKSLCDSHAGARTLD